MMQAKIDKVRLEIETNNEVLNTFFEKDSPIDSFILMAGGFKNKADYRDYLIEQNLKLGKKIEKLTNKRQ